MTRRSAFFAASPKGTADFNRDGLADIFWVDSTDQLYSIWQSSVSAGVVGVSFASLGAANMSSAYFGHPSAGVLGVADFNGDSRADVLYYPVNWSGLSDGVLFADFIRPPFEQNNRWVANSILPDSPAWAGLVDVDRDGTTDFFLQTSTGVKFFTMGDWKEVPPVYGPIPDAALPASDPNTDFAVYGSSPALSDSGWVVVGTGAFKEN